jgi:hypothetical protein
MNIGSDASRYRTAPHEQPPSRATLIDLLSADDAERASSLARGRPTVLRATSFGTRLKGGAPAQNVVTSGLTSTGVSSNLVWNEVRGPTRAGSNEVWNEVGVGRHATFNLVWNEVWIAEEFLARASTARS